MSFNKELLNAKFEVATWSKKKRSDMLVREPDNVEELLYLNLLNDILENGEDRDDRTGVGTKALFGKQLKFSLRENKLPLLTTKKMFTRGAIEELLFFLRGDTDTKKLEAKGVNIWKGNTSREFLDKRGLHHLKEGDMGPMYGKQWRDFNGNNIDQLAEAINLIKNEPHSRRIMITALNPAQMNQGVLAPCHTFMQFYVNNDNELSCQMYQRSCDYFLGFGFNLASYAILTHILAKITGTVAKELIMTFGDIHIYKNHIDQANIQLQREPYKFPTVTINKTLNSIADIEGMNCSDIIIDNYKYHPGIKAPMAI